MPSVRAGATMEPKNAARFGTTRRFLRAVFRAVVRANDAEWPFERGFRSAKLEMMIPKLLFTTPRALRDGWFFAFSVGVFSIRDFVLSFFAKLIFLGEKRYFKKNQSTKTERSSSHKKETDLFFFLSFFLSFSPRKKKTLLFTCI